MHFHAGDSPSSPLDSLLFLPSSHLPLVARANLHAQERDETWARAAYTGALPVTARHSLPLSLPLVWRVQGAGAV